MKTEILDLGLYKRSIMVNVVFPEKRYRHCRFILKWKFEIPVLVFLILKIAILSVFQLKYTSNNKTYSDWFVATLLHFISLIVFQINQPTEFT